MVFIEVEYIFAEVGLYYFGVYHNKVDHCEYFEDGTVLQTEIGDSFEDKQAFLLFVFGGDLFSELEGDAVPLIAHVVAVEHEDIGVLDVEFDVGDIFYADEILIRVVLHDVLAFQTLVLLLQPL